MKIMKTLKIKVRTAVNLCRDYLPEEMIEDDIRPEVKVVDSKVPLVCSVVPVSELSDLCDDMYKIGWHIDGIIGYTGKDTEKDKNGLLILSSPSVIISFVPRIFQEPNDIRSSQNCMWN